MNCIVTGGTSGLGRKIAEGLARAGHKVVLTSRQLASAEQVALEIGKSSGNADVFGAALNLASFDSIRKFAGDFAARGIPLHVLVNNAGVFNTKGTTAEG